MTNRPSILSTIARQTAPSVFHCYSRDIFLSQQVIDELFAVARSTARQRARLCMHQAAEEREQQMLIAFIRGAIDLPHNHLGKREALLPVLGEADYITYDIDGKEVNRVRLSPEGVMYTSSPPGVHHNIEVISKEFVFWEFSPGPFDPTLTQYAPWVQEEELREHGR